MGTPGTGGGGRGGGKGEGGRGRVHVLEQLFAALLIDNDGIALHVERSSLKQRHQVGE